MITNIQEEVSFINFHTLRLTSEEYSQLYFDVQCLICVPGEAQPHLYDLKEVIYHTILSLINSEVKNNLSCKIINTMHYKFIMK